MVSLDKAVIARYKSKDHHFEILVDGVLAMELKHGKEINVRDVLAVEEIFKDAKKGEKASEEAMKDVFGTDDVFKVAEEIIKHGEVQLTTEYRRKLTEEMRKRIISYIAKNAMDARTKTPIPPQRIELAMEQAKVHIDPFKPEEKQIEEIINKLRPFIPISFERKKILVKIPPQYTGKAYGILKEFGMSNEEWLNDGSLQARLTLPAGLVSDFYDKINHLTHGNADIKEV